METDKSAVLKRLVNVAYWACCMAATVLIAIMLLLSTEEGVGPLVAAIFWGPLIYAVGWSIRYVSTGITRIGP